MRVVEWRAERVTEAQKPGEGSENIPVQFIKCWFVRSDHRWRWIDFLSKTAKTSAALPKKHLDLTPQRLF